MKKGNNSSIPIPIKIQMLTLILKSFPCKEKKMVDIISQAILSPLESKVALWEIKAHPFWGVNGLSRKGAPFWRHWSLRGFSHYCSIPQLSWNTRGKPTCAQHKAGFVRPSSERPGPHEPGNQSLPLNWVSWQSYPIAVGWCSLVSLIVLSNEYLLCTFNGLGIEFREVNKRGVVSTLSVLN